MFNNVVEIASNLNINPEHFSILNYSRMPMILFSDSYQMPLTLYLVPTIYFLIRKLVTIKPRSAQTFQGESAKPKDNQQY